MKLFSALLSALILLPVSLSAGLNESVPPHRSSPHPQARGFNRAQQQHKPYVILVSLDGFRAEYLDRFDLPNFRRVMREGVRADGLIPVFPSVTAPNHYSIVTGLYPERHGIVGNVFYDPKRKQVFNHQTHSDSTWYRGQPLWVTAEAEGMVTACYFWIGCETDIHDMRPTYQAPPDQQVPNGAKVDLILSWLQLPIEQRPHFLAYYMTSEIDDAGHWYGPDPIEVGDVVRRADAELGYFLDRLQALPNHDEIYVLLVSDHGMAEARPEHVVALDGHIDASKVRTILSGPSANLHILDAAMDAQALRDEINRWLTHGHAYLRSEIPAHLHHRADPRVGDVVIIMEQPFVLSRLVDEEPWGQHGWDPSHPEMYGIFLAMGPDIKPGATIPAFENVHIYPLMTELLGLTAPPGIDGRTGWLQRLVRK